MGNLLATIFTGILTGLATAAGLLVFAVMSVMMWFVEFVCDVLEDRYGLEG